MLCEKHQSRETWAEGMWACQYYSSSLSQDYELNNVFQWSHNFTWSPLTFFEIMKPKAFALPKRLFYL